MKYSFWCISFLAVTVIPCVSAQVAAHSESNLLGDWRGRSACQVRESSCNLLDSFGVGRAKDSATQSHALQGPNPWFDITQYGARSFGSLTPTSTTASCSNGSPNITLTRAIDFANGDGITINQCGPATALLTPAAPTSVTPKGVLNGATQRSYKIAFEDFGMGITAASPATTTATAASAFGTRPANISSAALLSRTVTVITTGNHNFEAGNWVKVSGTSSSLINGLWQIQSIVNPTTFTFMVPFRNDTAVIVGAAGTAEVPAYNWLKWTASNGVMRTLIYRQDGGVGDYKLVGVANGMEPFFEDYGFAAPSIPEAPSTAPARALNQALNTTISSGAGTTNLVLSAKASNNASGQTAQHDVGGAILAAQAAAVAAKGGTVYIPNAPTGFGYFPVTYPLVNPNTGPITFRIAGQVSLLQPWVPNNFTTFEGASTKDGGSPSFAQTNTYGVVTVLSYPGFLIPTKTTIDFDKMHIRVGAGITQSIGVLVDVATVGGGGSTAINIRDSYLNTGQQTNAALVLRGVGFGHLIEKTTFGQDGMTSRQYYYPAAVRLEGSSISSPTGWPGIGYMRDITLLGSGIQVESNPTGGTITNGGSPWTFENVFSESLCQPMFHFRNINTNNWFAWSFRNLNAADNQSGCSATQLDMSNPTVASLDGLRLERINAGGTTGVNAMIRTGAATGVQLIRTSANDIVILPPTSLSIGYADFNQGRASGTTGQQLIASDGVFRVDTNSTSPGAFIIAGDPPTNVVAALGTGGLVPVGTHSYDVTAVDQNGGETEPQAAANTVTTKPGNQTVKITWSAPSIAPLGGYNVYRDNGRVATGITVTSFSDTSAAPGTVSAPKATAGGPGGFNRVFGLWTQDVQVTRHAKQFAANSDFAGKVTCSAGSIAKVFTTAFTSTPVVLLTDETTKGGANFSAISNTGFTVSCAGATDVVDYLVIGNPN